MMSLPQVLSRSIKAKIIITLVVIVATILSLFEINAQRVERKLLTVELEQSAEQKINRLADNLILPLWEIDDKWVGRVIDAEMTDQSVSALIVRGDGGFHAGKVRDGQWRAIDGEVHTFTGDFISLSRDVMHGNEKIGAVTIHLTKKFIENRLRQKTVYGVVAHLILCVFLVVFLWLFLNRSIIRPLRDVLAIAKAVGEGDYSREITIKQSDEIGMLADGVNLMKQNISSREQELNSTLLELKRKSWELQNSRNELEEKVESRTVELRMANEKLKEVDRLKSMFIASMSHELRTPLNSIIGFSSILHDEWLGPVNDEQKLNLASILHNGEHLLALINDVIDISKIEADKIDIRITTFELREVINEAVEGFKVAIKDKGLALRLEVGDATMTTDRRRLLQVILNLINNAVKFTNAGVITVEAKQEKDGLVSIAVADSGIGIQAEAMDKLFKAFSRVHVKGDVEYPGTGLGLYLSMKLAREVLRGELKAASTYGQGSTFTLSLPMRIQE